MSLLSTSSSIESSSHTPAGLPSPLPFEVALAIKIKGRRMSPTHTFIRLDEDEDGLISKRDLQDSLGEVFGMGLSDDQIEVMFNRACFFRSTSTRDVESRNDPQASGERGIDFATFQKYIEHTAMDTSSPSSTMYGSYGGMTTTVKKNKDGVPRRDSRSVFAKTKLLRSKVLRLLEQSATTDGMAATRSFLDMDTLRNNHVTRGEFMEWLRDVNGVNLTEEELDMVLGEWQDEEGLTMTEFTLFVDSLKVNSGTRTSPDEPIMKHTFIHPRQINVSDNDKSDNELIWAFLNHFRAIGITLVQGFHHLDETDSKNLSAAEISKGFNKAGLNVSQERSRELIIGFIMSGRLLDKPGFVRMMTSVVPIPNPPDSD